VKLEAWLDRLLSRSSHDLRKYVQRSTPCRIVDLRMLPPHYTLVLERKLPKIDLLLVQAAIVRAFKNPHSKVMVTPLENITAMLYETEYAVYSFKVVTIEWQGSKTAPYPDLLSYPLEAEFST
jgi:hypothetical protein